MKKITTIVALLAILLAIKVAHCTSATDSQFTYITDQKDTLKGLHGVEVVVENPGPEVEKHGLTRQQIQTDVELKLRLAGIKVFSEKERLLSAGMPINI